MAVAKKMKEFQMKGVKQADELAIEQKQTEKVKTQEVKEEKAIELSNKYLTISSEPDSDSENEKETAIIDGKLSLAHSPTTDSSNSSDAAIPQRQPDVAVAPDVSKCLQIRIKSYSKIY